MAKKEDESAKSVVSAWSLSGPKREARELVAMLGRNGDTPESLRALIDIPPKDREDLSRWANTRPELAGRIRSAFTFRGEVRREFDRLVQQRLQR